MAATAIIQTAFIGDVILATPLADAARASLPGTEIVFVVRAGCENLVTTHPAIDRVVVWDKHGRNRGIGGVFRIARELRSIGIETAVVPHRSLRSAAVAKMAGIPVRIGFDRGGGRFLHTERVPYITGIHEVERNLMLAAAAGWEHEGFTPRIVPDADDIAMIDDIVRGLGDYMVFAPGSVWATKMWPIDYYIELGQAFTEQGFRIIVSGGGDDADICRAVEAGIPGAVDVCGVLSLRRSAELYRRASVVVTGDSAPQHIASAMGARVVAVFGPTVREFGFTPYGQSGVVVEEDVPCRPCGIHGHAVCPEGHHRCMRAVTPGRVKAAVEALME